MGEKILEFILNFIKEVLPCWIIDQYEGGVKLRFGKYVRTLGPGFYFKIPFLEKIIEDMVITTTMGTPSQTLTTKDGKTVSVKGVIKYSISDIKLFLLEVTDRFSAMSDVTQSVVKEQIEARTWQECMDIDLDNTIEKKVRLNVKKWGINIEDFTLVDKTITRSYRLFTELKETI